MTIMMIIITATVAPTAEPTLDPVDCVDVEETVEKRGKVVVTVSLFIV